MSRRVQIKFRVATSNIAITCIGATDVVVYIFYRSMNLCEFFTSTLSEKSYYW